MIARITVGSGSRRTSIALTPDKPTRYDISRKLKGFLFPTQRDYQLAQSRGARTLATSA